MIVPAESQNTVRAIPFPLDAQKRPPASFTATARVPQVSPDVPVQLNLAASHVLVGLVSAVSFVGIVFWALLRLWLFE